MQLPASFYVTALILAGLFVELWSQRKMPWALPAFMVYATIVAWYYLDIVLYGEKYRGMPATALEVCYWEVLIFLVAFRFLTPTFSRHLARPLTGLVPFPVDAEILFMCTAILWAGLLLCGVYRMDWNLFGALLPLDSRAGDTLWARGAAGDAGSTGFLVSTGGYLYLVVCSFFGILSVLVRRLPAKLAAFALMLISWPAFLLGGSRNQFLAVGLPWAFCYLLFGRERKVIRLSVLAGAFLLVNAAFLVIVSHRTNGLRDYLAGTEEVTPNDEDQSAGHEGLNMSQELCFINIFLHTGQLELTWGQDYWYQVANAIPRVLWPGKPLMGIEYAKLRGFGGNSNDIGVFATVSTGMIGQGVLEYGPIFGPLAPAILMALWCALLARWWQQRASVLRLCLYLLALGITFNLGRDITSLTLWPVIFAYVFVRFLEKLLPDKAAYSQARLLGVPPLKMPRNLRPAPVRAGRVAGSLSQP